MYQNKGDKVIYISNQIKVLQVSLLEHHSHERNKELAERYNRLRQEAKELINAPNFDRLIPVARCVKLFPDILLICLLIMVVTIFLGLLLYQFGPESRLWMNVVMVISVAFTIILILYLSGSFSEYQTSEIRQISLWTQMLAQFIQDYINLSPNLRSYITTESRIEYEKNISNLRAKYTETKNKLEIYEQELSKLQSLYKGLSSPSTYDIPTDVLDKLSQLERTKILEAIQAYKVNAWTPAAAVCGMLLEGRLQKLCNENDLKGGSFGQMIEQLGNKGLLKGHYQNLAKIGEFFRHRSAHPTTEEFDKEKTTLIIASLILLIRDLF